MQMEIKQQFDNSALPVKVEMKQLLEDIKKPNDLLQWMKKNLRYESGIKGYLRKPQSVFIDKKAHCWEATDFEHFVLKNLNLSCESLYIETPDCKVTHTALIFESNNNFYWFEWAWKKHEGIHKFKTKDELIARFRNAFIEEYRNYAAFVITSYKLIREGDDETKVVNRLSSLKTNAIKHRDLLGFRVLDSNEENISFYKRQYSSLSHVRTGGSTSGIILVDPTTEKFVAVLQLDLVKGFIVALEVSALYRNKGIGAYLLARSVHQYKVTKLTVNKNNTSAIRLYRSCGWDIIDDSGSMFTMEHNTSQRNSSKPIFNKW